MLPSQAPSHPLWVWAPASSPVALGHGGLRVPKTEHGLPPAAPPAVLTCMDPLAPCTQSPLLPWTRRPLGPLPLWPGHRPAPSLPTAQPGRLADCSYRLRKATRRLLGGAARWALGPAFWQPLNKDGASLGAQTAKRLFTMWETRVRFLGQEDSPGEGNGNPLQYSCLGNPMDGGAWWATVHGVTKSQTRLSD